MSLKVNRPCETVPQSVPVSILISAKCWSEWQDLNLRPPRPERGALRDQSVYPFRLPSPALSPDARNDRDAATASVRFSPQAKSVKVLAMHLLAKFSEPSSFASTA